MKNLFNKFRRISSKTKIAVVIALLAIAVPATINAWGPDRQLFTMAKPATFVTFNSITDNSVVGDERNFVVIKDAANTSDGGWKDNITVERGKEYLVRVYVHNNAADNLGLKALNTRVSAGIPTNTAKNISISGFVSSDNATPKQVWDDASFNSTENFNLAYVAGSAEIYNNGYARGGKSLPDSIVTSAGAKIGFDGPDGIVPGCFKYDNFIFFKVKPQFAPVNDYSFTKQVRKEGSTEWSKSVQANPGDTVEYMLSYKNTGEVRQNNVVMRDQMPDKISLINDTTYLRNGTNPNGLKISNNINTAAGVNIGDYNAQAAAYVKYSAKVASADKLVCGKNDLVNKAKVVVDGTQIEDSATVTVNKDCPKPTNPKIDITKKVNGADSATVEVNKPFVYTVVVKNTGDVDLKDAKVSDPAPAGVTFQSADRGSISNNTWNYTISSLKVGASETFKITAIVKEYKEGDIKNTACVDTPTIPGSPDDCDDAKIKVVKPTNPKIDITKKVNGADSATVEVNKPFVYTVVVKNTGDVDLKDAKVSDPAPAGVTFQSADRGSISNNTWNYTISSLKVGASETFKITAIVKEYKEGDIKNTACVDTPTIPGSPDDCDDAKITVVKPTNPKIDITKKVNGADSATVEVNKPFVYTVVVKNTGDVDLKDAKVSDPAPAGVTFQSADRGSISNNTWNYTISSLKVGASETFKITAIVKEYKGGDIKNTACVDTPTIPGSPDDCDDATVKVTEEPVPPAPEKEVVCELDTKKVITIDKDAFDDAKHSRNLDDCKETEEPQKPVAPVIPGTPDQLPQTGMADGLLSAAGLFALVTSTVAYAVSRRSL